MQIKVAASNTSSGMMAKAIVVYIVVGFFGMQGTLACLVNMVMGTDMFKDRPESSCDSAVVE